MRTSEPADAPFSSKKSWLLYFLAIALPFLTLWVRMQLPVTFGQRPLLILFMPCVLLVAILGGLGPGLIATVTAGLVTAFFLIPPIGRLWISQGHDLFQWGMLLLSGGMISLLAERQRKTHALVYERQVAMKLTETELALKSANEANLKALFDAVPDAIIVSNTMGNVVQVNQRTLSLFGYTPEHLIGQPIDMLVPEHLRSQHAEDRANYMAHPETRPMGANMNLSACRNDGSEIPVAISLSTYQTEGQTFVISAIRDMTELRRMETRMAAQQAELQHSRERLQVATDAGQIGIWDYDFIDNILLWDDWMYKLYGVERDQFSGAYEAWSSSVYPDDLAPASVALQAAARGEAKFDTRFRIIHPDGVVRWIHANAVAVPGEDGRLRRLIGTNIDITDTVVAESRLVAMLGETASANRSLEISNKELDAFSYSVSHDLRAPLRAIDGFSNLLLKKYSDKIDDQGRELLERMRAATQRMGQLIDDMLLLSRISRAELVTEDFDLSILVEEVVTHLREAFPDRVVETLIQPAIHAHGDPKLVRIVLDNLLGNAWKFTSKSDYARVEFGCDCQDGRAEYFVRDNGAGFDMAYADKLFGAFQRLHSANEFQGSGIGLATVARVIHKHGGSVRAESIVGQGATFWFSLQP